MNFERNWRRLTSHLLLHLHRHLVQFSNRFNKSLARICCCIDRMFRNSWNVTIQNFPSMNCWNVWNWMEQLFVRATGVGFFLSEVHMHYHVPQTKGVWVSLAYTRGFGSLGPKFKSWYAHQLIDAWHNGQACVQSTKR